MQIAFCNFDPDFPGGNESANLRWKYPLRQGWFAEGSRGSRDFSEILPAGPRTAEGRVSSGFRWLYLEAMQQATRCPHCDELSRVPASAIGQYVACPHCRQPFNAEPADLPEEPPPSSRKRNVPVVHPPKKPDPVPEWQESEAEPTSGPKNVLFGLALLPFVIPLLWILGPTLTGKEAIFTFALPMAIAISSAGLCFGIVLAADWSFATRVKAILAIVFVMHFLAALLYFMKAEWVEAIRKEIGRGRDAPSRQFSPQNENYTVRVPAEMQDNEQPLVTGWDLKGYRSVDRHGPPTYFVARGRQPAELNNEKDEKFFAEATAKVVEAVQGTIISDDPVRNSGYPGRQLALMLPDKNTKRIVQIFRVERFAFVAAMEDSFLTPDAPDVKYFFKNIDLTPKK